MTVTEQGFSTDTPYVAYSYSYPHKSAYRELNPPVLLENLWARERLESLFLYFHLPFCEYRCGFCNLFTLAQPRNGIVDGYLRQLAVEAEAVSSVISDARFASVAIGGGTPTFLNDAELRRFLEIATRVLKVVPRDVPVSCEASPATLTSTKAALLRQWGVDRLSLGIQTFDDRESRALGRPQHAREARLAIDVARKLGFPTLNLDLIYGVPGQSVDSWMRSVNEAIRARPEEIYLYPLYVRELTGLGRLARKAGGERLAAYRRARERMLEAGYRQSSLRMFRLPDGEEHDLTTYRCQSDGMVGLGCGARSYTETLHYSTEFAVGRGGVRAILGDYLDRGPRSFLAATHGYELDDEDRRRRFCILSLLQAEGLSVDEYRLRFGTGPLEDLPRLRELIDRGFARESGGMMELTDEGLELSDAIGPWLYSSRVKELMEGFPCR